MRLKILAALAISSALIGQVPQDVIGYQGIPWKANMDEFKKVCPLTWVKSELCAKAKFEGWDVTILPHWGGHLDKVLVRVEGIYDSHALQSQARQAIETALVNKYGPPTTRTSGDMGDRCVWRFLTTTIDLKPDGVRSIRLYTLGIFYTPTTANTGPSPL